MSPLRTYHTTIQRQRGVVFIVMMVILVLGTATFLVSSLNSASLQIARDQVTADALAQAKEALIGYAASVDLTSGSKRPGDLPCPDTNNDGLQEASCGNASGSTGQTTRIGRLPWKTLGLPDLRDGSGERLWYAVSNNFKYNFRTTCSSSGQPGCLNSDTAGTITVRGADGTIINDATAGSGVAAVIIAPGDVLQRQGAVSPQNRSCTVGVNCDATEKCTTVPPTLTPKCAPVNYLDDVAAEDNASFTDNPLSTDGFIQGRIKDSSGNVILNDQLLVITQDNIMQAIQKRVAAEVKLCLSEYAADPQNNNRYPWGAPITDLIGYQDQNGRYFGRVPDTPFVNTCQSSDGNFCSQPIPIGGMSTMWGGNCNISSGSGWWLNWKEMVFYGVASSFKPRDTNAPSFPSACASPGNCLNIGSSSTPARFVVIVAGKKFPAQNRATSGDQSTASNYLEGGNENADQSGGYTFIQSAPSATFNDTLVYQ